MAHTEPLRVPCARCSSPTSVSESQYQQAGGEVYCEECLVPFTCESCGERKYTIPENIQPDSGLICQACNQTRGASKSRGVIETWVMMVVYGGIAAAVLGVILLGLSPVLAPVLGFQLLTLQDITALGSSARVIVLLLGGIIVAYLSMKNE